MIRSQRSQAGAEGGDEEGTRHEARNDTTNKTQNTFRFVHHKFGSVSFSGFRGFGDSGQKRSTRGVHSDMQIGEEV